MPRTLLTASLAIGAISAILAAQAGPGTPADCVTIGAPSPERSFSYRYADSTGGSSDYTNRWEQFTPTGSKLVTTRAGATSEYVSQHQVVDDVFVLEATTSVGTDGGGPFKNSMTFKPGAIGDPAYRACAGRTWTIPAVAVTSQSRQGSFSSRTDPGTLRIVATSESVTVPAGTFRTVRYTKTMNSARGSLVDEFWKSIEHGVTVRRTFRQPGANGEEVLVGIK